MKEKNKSEYMSVKEVTYHLGISRATIYRHRKSKKLKDYAIGRRILLKRSEVEDVIKIN